MAVARERGDGFDLRRGMAQGHHNRFGIIHSGIRINDQSQHSQNLS